MSSIQCSTVSQPTRMLNLIGLNRQLPRRSWLQLTVELSNRAAMQITLRQIKSLNQICQCDQKRRSFRKQNTRHWMQCRKRFMSTCHDTGVDHEIIQSIAICCYSILFAASCMATMQLSNVAIYDVGLHSRSESVMRIKTIRIKLNRI